METAATCQVITRWAADIQGQVLARDLLCAIFCTSGNGCSGSYPNHMIPLTVQENRSNLSLGTAVAD